MNRPALLIAALLVGAFAVSVEPAAAQRGRGGFDIESGQQDRARQGVRQGRIVPLGPVLDQIRRRTPGRQLDAGLEDGPGGRPVYRIRWAADDGRRIDYIVDAETGAVIGANGE